MSMFRHFDLGSDFTVFFLGLAILFIVVGVLLARVAPKKGHGGGRQKYDDALVDRNRELID